MRTAAGKIGNFVLTVGSATGSDYQKTYSITSLILMFFTFSGIGWIWEVMIHIVEDGMIINRGVMTGPWLPIYGTGGVLILVVLKKWHDRPLHLFGMIMLLCGTIEYVTSIVLEKLFGAIWWDYSDMVFQIQGRVCLGGLLIFGMGGLFIVYLAAPALDRQVHKLSDKARIILCGCLLLLFVGDMICSFFNPNMGFGITT